MRTRKYLITAIIFIVILIAGLNFGRLKFWFTFAFLVDHFNKNEKVFITKESLTDKKFNGMIAYRLVRPITEKDIDTMVLTRWERLKLLASIDQNQKPLLISLDTYFDKLKMQKNKSGYLGNYIKTERSFYRFPNDTTTYESLFYAIVPNRKVFHEDAHDYLHEFEKPKNYIFADTLIYIAPFDDLSDEEVKL